MTDVHEEYVVACHPERAELERTIAGHRHLNAAPPDPGPRNYKTSHGMITAHIEPSATIGEGSVVWHFSVVLQRVRIGKHVMIGARSEIGRGSVIGDYSRIGSGVFLPPDSVIGERVFIGPNVTMTDDRTPKVPSPGDAPYSAEPPHIGDGAAIGAGAVILPGVRIGAYARVAAGAVVTKDVPAFAMVIGMPAREREPSPESQHWMVEPSSTPRSTGSL